MPVVTSPLVLGGFGCFAFKLCDGRHGCVRACVQINILVVRIDVTVGLALAMNFAVDIHCVEMLQPRGMRLHHRV